MKFVLAAGMTANEQEVFLYHCR